MAETSKYDISIVNISAGGDSEQPYLDVLYAKLWNVR